jgi:hypothetical protein
VSSSDPTGENLGVQVATAVATSVTEPLRELVTVMLRPITDIVGGATVPLRLWNFKRMLAATQRAAEMLNAAGISASTPASRVYFPLLEGAAAEGNGELHVLWAALIANAHGGSETIDVFPAYPHILEQLSPFDAALLQYFGEQSVPYDRIAGDQEVWIELDAIRHTFEDQSEEQVLHSVGNLIRLGLIEWTPPGRRDPGTNNINMIVDVTELRISAVGAGFIRACRAPIQPARSTR